MLGEIAIYGVYLPALLLMAMAAAILTGILGRLLQRLDFYRFTAGRPATDLCMFTLVLSAIVRVTAGRP